MKGGTLLGNISGSADMNTPLIIGKGGVQVKNMLPSLHIPHLALWETTVGRMQILAAIPGLSERLGRAEAQCPATRTLKGILKVTSLSGGKYLST